MPWVTINGAHVLLGEDDGKESDGSVAETAARKAAGLTGKSPDMGMIQGADGKWHWGRKDGKADTVESAVRKGAKLPQKGDVSKDAQQTITNNFENIKQYDALGVRGLQNDEKYRVGDYARNSRDWDMENDTSSNIELSGTSAIRIDHDFETADDLIASINNAGVTQYGNGRYVLLGGYR